MDDKPRKKIDLESIAICTATVLSVGVIIVSGAISFKQSRDPRYQYENNAKIEYNGEAYSINDIYLLSSDTEKHVCKLEEKSHISGGYGLTLNGELKWSYRNVDDPDIYIDIQSNKIIAVEGLEDQFGYSVEKIAPYFPYEEYGIDGNLVIPQDKVDELTITNNSKSL